MNRVDLTQIPAYLQKQRWFGGKAWPIKNVSVADHVAVDLGGEGRWHAQGSALLTVVDVSYELGNPERYVLPVIPHNDGMSDAFDNEEFARALLKVMLEGKSIPSGNGALRGEKLEGSEKLFASLGPRPALRRLGVEQSNTSLSFEDKVLLKLLRKLEPGVNPEYEMGQFLSRVGFKGSPLLLGSLRLEGPSDALVAVAHEFIPARADGWAYVLESLRHGGAPAPELLGEIRKLGKCVAQLHAVLASEQSNPAFAPEPILLEDFQRWSSSIIGELGVTLSLAADKVPELSERRQTLIALAQRLAHVEAGGQKIRVHGDLHLGQVLLSNERGWIIFDFEGEPSRTFSQRREKHSPLKDVAGMLRSFSYAVATVDREKASSADRVAPCRQAFLDGYLGEARGQPFLPPEPTFTALLEALELEKLFYELRYEVQHRPDWIQIPARSLLEMNLPT